MKKINKKSFFYILACISLSFLFILPFFNRSKIKTIASAETSYGSTYLNTDYYYFQRCMFYMVGSNVTYLSRVNTGFSFNFSYGLQNTFQLTVNLGSAGGVQTYDSVSLTSYVHRTLNRNGSNQYVYFMYQYDPLEPDMYFSVPYGFSVFNRGLDQNINIDLGMSPTYPVYYLEIRFLFEETSKQVASIYIPFAYNSAPTDFDLFSKTVSFYTLTYSDTELNYINGYQKGYDKGLNDGKQKGFDELNPNSNNYIKGYDMGYLDGLSNAPDQISFDTSIKNFVLSLFNVPASIFGGFLNLEYAGFNLGGLIALLVTIPIVMFVVKWLT